MNIKRDSTTTNMEPMLTREFRDNDLGTLRSSVVMSAMTRGFADKNHCAVDAMAQYYGIRARYGAAIIITEGIIVHQRGDGYNNVPHMTNLRQSHSWRIITEEVHKHKSLIFAQLWHCGRVSHQDYTGGVAPLSSTTEQLPGVNRQNGKPYAKPNVTTSDDISEIVDSFANSANLCKLAGFDGVELHFGHGYLVDQFLNGSVNRLENEYGGSSLQRCRLATEIFQKVCKVYRPERVMVRISPVWKPGGELSLWYDWKEQVSCLLYSLQHLGCRLIDISAGNADFTECAYEVINHVRPNWRGLIIGGSSLNLVAAEEYLRQGTINLVSWGRLFISNPDFVKKLRDGKALVPFESKLLQTLN